MNTPKLRFKEFRDEWQEKKLGEVGYFYYGKSVPKPSVTKEGETPCVRYGELYSTYKGKIDTIRSYTNLNPLNLKLSKGGELLIPRVGEEPLDFINCSYLPIGGVAIGEMISIYNTEQNVPYLVYYIRGKLRKIFARVVEGGNVSNLYFRYLEKIKINIPSLSEQQKIAEFLGTVDEKVNKLEEKKKWFEKYKKGVMQAIFSQKIRFKNPSGKNFPDWEDKKLGELCKITTGKLDANAMVPNGKYRFYTCAKDYFQINNYAFDTEALLVSGNGANVGYIHYYNGKFNAYQRTYILDKFTENIFFIKYALQKDLYQRIQIEKKEGNTPYIVLDTLASMNVALPQKEEQKKIADFLTSLDNKIDLINNQLEQTKLFKKGLLQQMFV